MRGEWRRGRGLAACGVWLAVALLAAPVGAQEAAGEGGVRGAFAIDLDGLSSRYIPQEASGEPVEVEVEEEVDSGAPQATDPVFEDPSTELGGRVFGLLGIGVGDGTYVTTGAGAGLRLNKHLGLDVELSYFSQVDETDASWLGRARDMVSDFTGGFLEGFPGSDAAFTSFAPESQRRDVTAFLTRFTIEFPVGGRVIPYLTAGGGVARVTGGFGFGFGGFPEGSFDGDMDGDWMDEDGEDGPWVDEDGMDGDGMEGGWEDFGSPFGGPFFRTPGDFSEVGLGLVLGGGVDVKLWRGFGVGVDARWLRILASRNPIDIAQVAARLSYRF